MRILPLLLALCCAGSLPAQLSKIKKAGQAAGTAAKKTSEVAKEVKKDATAVGSAAKKEAKAAGETAKDHAAKQPPVVLGKKVVKGAKETGQAFKEGVKEGAKK